MTIDKLPCPAKQNETVLKVNEIIDGKQDVLVSGTNIKTVNNISLLGSGNIDTNDIFIAEYDNNSYSDITNAITSGKAVFLRKEDDTVLSNTLYYPLSYIDDSNSTYYFSMVGDDTTNVVSVDNTSSWSYRSTDLQAKLISGTSIKTINNESLLGSGNINISSGGTVDQTYDPTSTNAQSGVAIAGAGFLTGITSSDIVTALTYTPYDASNPDGFITSAALSGYATETWVGQQGFLTSSDLTNYVTTNTDQNITGVKTFVGQKMIAFKQSTSSNKLGFTLYNNSGTEKGYLEFNPTNTIDGAPLMTLGNYATSASAITHVGFRKYSSVSGASGAYNLLAPLISNARTPFSLTTTYTNFYLPLGFTNGTTMVTTASTGVVDLSSLLPTIPTVPTKISDLSDDTATYPIDKADTLTGLTATVSELNVLDGITATTTELNYVDGVTSDIQTQFNTITGKIPSQASASNQLADKSFVNSTVQTATANFRGNWDTWSAVPTSASSYPADYSGSTTPTVNDYLVVQDASGYTGDTLEGTWRFKYSGTWSTDGKAGWLPEYQVNETPLTSAQLAALNSGITSSDVTLIGTALQPSNVDQTYSASSTNAQSGTAVASAISTKQNTLVSGTNIKTINSTSLLGSGDISVGTVTSVNNTSPINGNVTLSIPSVDQSYNSASSNAQSGVAIAGAGFLTEVTSSDVIDGLGYTPVNKVGDTMTGGLCVETSTPAIDLKDTVEVAGTTPSSERLKAVIFRDKNNKAVGRVQNIYLTTGARRTILNCTDATGNNSENIYIGYDANGNIETYAPTPSNGDNSTKIATTAFVNTVSANKVDKSGDTMTGNLAVLNGTPRFYLRDSNEVAGTSPSASITKQLNFQDKNSVLVGYVGNSYLTTGERYTVIASKDASGNNGTEIRVGYDTNGNVYTYAPTPASTSNGTNIATTAWVNSNISNKIGWTISYSQLVNTATTMSGATTLTYSLANYLPSDNYVYEVMYSVKGTTGSTSGNEADISIGSGLISVTTHRVAAAQTRTSNSVSWAASGIMLIGNTTGGSEMRAIYIRQIANSSCTLNYFRVYAYRRLNYAL